MNVLVENSQCNLRLHSMFLNLFTKENVSQDPEIAHFPCLDSVTCSICFHLFSTDFYTSF